MHVQASRKRPSWDTTLVHVPVSSVLGAFREALIAVDRHSRTETEEFLPQKRSRLYGLAATLTRCPQGNPGSGLGFCSGQSQDRAQPEAEGSAHSAPSGRLKLTSAFSSQSITTAPTTAAALTCACRASAAPPAAAPTPRPRVETETCELEVIPLNKVRPRTDDVTHQLHPGASLTPPTFIYTL